MNIKNDSKIDISNLIILNKSDKEKNEFNYFPIEKVKSRNSSLNINIEKKNDKKKDLNIGIFANKAILKK